jgi:hypothetical protein
MNERIRELALQANGPNPFYGTLKNQMTLLGDDAVEKFAELIVRECATAIINDGRLNDVRSAANGCVRTIREHFGVEE